MKEIVIALLEYLLGENGKSISTDLPANGVITLYEQKKEKRYVNHLLYVTPVLRGKVEVIEDIVPIYNIHVSFKTDKKIKRCYLAPSGKEISFTQDGANVSYVVPEICCNTVVVADYEGE